MRALVRGLGNIGTTLGNVLLEERQRLGLDAVILQKGAPQPFLDADLERLESRGARVVRGPDLQAEFDTGSTFVFDCRRAGAPRADRAWYEASHVAGAVAQGTEVGFGPPFVTGINPDAVAGRRFVQVASCNTHALTTILDALTGNALEELLAADFVVVRRSEDIGGRERLVGGAVVARHREAEGTHHAVGVRHVYATRGLAPEVTSSDVTTPSQLLHTVRFSVRFPGRMRAAVLQDRLDGHPLLALTAKFDAHRIFELGRRYGVQGRIYAHAIVVFNNLLVREEQGGTVVRGWAFVPQEGNTILSTLDAFLLQTAHPERASAREALAARLIQRAW